VISHYTTRYPSHPAPLERIKGIANEVGAALATLRLRRICASAPAYDSHCVAAINMLIKRQRAGSVNLQYISIQQRILIGREALSRGIIRGATLFDDDRAPLTIGLESGR